jgi:hypothetical protein
MTWSVDGLTAPVRCGLIGSTRFPKNLRSLGLGRYRRPFSTESAKSLLMFSELGRPDSCGLITLLNLVVHVRLLEILGPQFFPLGLAQCLLNESAGVFACRANKVLGLHLACFGNPNPVGMTVYWIASSTDRRHAPGCRYYRRVPGCTGPRIRGKACRLCGS